MEEISNKTLAILLIGAIVISLGGTLISLNRLARIRIPIITGLATTDTATVDIEITGLTEVNWTTDAIQWGTGYVTGGFSFCVMNSYDASRGANCTDFTAVTTGLVLENIGNRNVTLNISTSNDAAGFIGDGSSFIAVYKWNASNLEGNSCPGLAITEGAWQTALDGTHTVVCNSTGGGFLAGDTSDTMKFDVLIEIPSDADPGTKASTITATIAEI